MQFGAIGLKRPEAFPKPFNIYRQATYTSDKGREMIGASKLAGSAKCILSIISPDERQRFGQIGVTVTHTIFHQGAAIAQLNDYFALLKDGVETRYFRVQEIQNHGDMNIFTTYYCEERGDINGIVRNNPD